MKNTNPKKEEKWWTLKQCNNILHQRNVERGNSLHDAIINYRANMIAPLGALVYLLNWPNFDFRNCGGPMPLW